MTLNQGDPAVGFKLPAKVGDEVDVSAFMGKDRIVLLFFPLAFSPVCTDEMCHFRDNWSQWEGLEAKVFGISVDSPFVTDRFRQENQVPFPILSDFNKEVCTQYGVVHEELIGLKGVAKRSAFVISADGKIAYKWVTDDPRVQVPFDEIKTAVQATGATQVAT